MKEFCISFLLIFMGFISLSQDISTLPEWNIHNESLAKIDWLVSDCDIKANVYKSADGKNIILYNGLLKREFRISPNLACIDYKNMVNGQQLLRAIKPEAKIIFDNKEHRIGGLTGQSEHAYLIPSWVDDFKAGSEDFKFSSFTISDLKPFINWKCKTWIMPVKQASGKLVSFIFNASDEKLKGLEVTVNYELYDGIPLIVKWVSIENISSAKFKLNRVTNEVLALVEEESAVVGSPEQMKKQHGIYVETNYAFNNAMRYDISDQTTHWKTDSVYTSQVNYNYETPCLLEIYPEKAPGIELQPGEIFKSVRTHELLMDSYDRERRGLAIRRMYKNVAPWTNQNPIFMHMVSRSDKKVMEAIDQCAETGYEALIMSFGSHCNMEDNSPKNLEKWKTIADYAHKKGILIGSYSLFSSRKISDADDVIDSKTGNPGGAFFGNAPCFGSNWGLSYRDKIKQFYNYTGFDIWESHWPYPGDVCASTTHPGHKGLEDSQWRQMEIQKELYHWLNEKGVYINAPDWYFLDGTHKIAIGYREVNFSLSREQQRILNRQNIYDGTWEKNPSMSWGFVPLTKYQGGGPEAILEPLSEHLKDYEQLMVQYYGAGVQACYRGPRLYDTGQTKNLVINTVNWYKKYREILNSDIIHLRRADGRDWDGIMHVNPNLKQKAFLLVYNPTKGAMEREIRVPLYYAGLTDQCIVKEKDADPVKYNLNRDYTIDMKFTIEPESYNWFVIE